MKDEEMAEEFANEKCKDCYMCSYSEHKNPYKICQRRKDVKQAFLAGLKAGRPQWHDLRKNKNLVPDSPRLVLIQCIDSTYCEFSYYIDNSWILNRNVPVIAWCEIPTFDKE
jgi:hypothetical protein